MTNSLLAQPSGAARRESSGLLAQPGSAARPERESEPRTGLATVSVIVPCFNYGHLLEGCLASVLSQEGVDVRVLVIDDRSTDDSAAAAARLAEREERVELRLHTENMGLIATANEGLEWAPGEYVVLLSADDLLVPGSLRRASEVMARHPNVGMVYGKTLQAAEGRPFPEPSGRWRSTKVWSGADWVRIRCRSTYNCISSPEVVVRSSVQRAVGGYDPACHHSSDLNMWLRIAAVADIAYVRGVPQAIYRVHSDSMLRSAASTMVDLRERRIAFDSFFASRPGQPGPSVPLKADRIEADRRVNQLPGGGPERDHLETDRLRRMAARTLARQALWRASRAVDQGAADGVVRELAGFALDVYPDARRLREWRGLRLRQWIGAGRSLRFPPFIATGAAHRLRSHAIRMRWRLRGI
ncbi:MAG: glycosyltransferase [Solirubrobacterales bacterium]